MRSLQKLAIVVALFALSACTAQEEQVLNAFFEAVQRGNEDMLASVSTASFTGDVESWELVEIGPESSARFTLPDLHERLLEKRNELELEIEKNTLFAADNRSLFEQYRARHEQDPDVELSGDLGEFQAEWEERMKQQEALGKEVEALEEEFRALRSAAGLSLNTEVNQNFLGDVKDKKLHLKVHDGDGEKSYTFTLQRYELADAERNIAPISRWIITGIEEQA